MSEPAPADDIPVDRVAAYSDGIIAIIVTIMVLELHAPSSDDPIALFRMWPTLGAYALSFVLVSIYWVNHHHLLRLNRRMDVAAIWLNINWLFWLSLFPFATSYLSSARAGPFALSCYAALGILVALAYRLLGSSLNRLNGGAEDGEAIAPGRRRLNTFAACANACAIPVAYASRPIAVLLMVAPAALYFLPDRRLRGRRR